MTFSMLPPLISEPHGHGYFGRRWHAQIAWRTVFWRDMLMVGSMANIVMGFLALVLVSQRVDVVWALTVHFALLPYNLFLLATAWRWPKLHPKWRWAASAWFAMTLVV
jgi:hypothetical protein